MSLSPDLIKFVHDMYERGATKVQVGDVVVEFGGVPAMPATQDNRSAEEIADDTKKQALKLLYGSSE